MSGFSTWPGPGITKLSQLTIDTDKDWAAHLIKNLGAGVDPADAVRLNQIVTQLSGLGIDVSKNWGAFRIDNLGWPTADLSAARLLDVKASPLQLPKWDYLVSAMPAGGIASLLPIGFQPGSWAMIPVGNRALLQPSVGGVPNTANYMATLPAMSFKALAAMTSSVYSSAVGIVNNRYIYYVQGNAAGPIKGSNLYRYDLFTDAWATMALITTLNANYRFDIYSAPVWDGADTIYLMGGWDNVNWKATWAYSISGNSWSAKLDNPAGTYQPAGGAVMVGQYIYCMRNAGVDASFDRYDSIGNAWVNLAPITVASGQLKGLVQDLDDTDKLLCFNWTGANLVIDRYSITTGLWTNLYTGAAPGNWGSHCCKPIYYSKPVPHVLFWSNTPATAWFQIFRLP